MTQACDSCGTEDEGHLFTCSYCGRNHCAACRLPENHYCREFYFGGDGDSTRRFESTAPSTLNKVTSSLSDRRSRWRSSSGNPTAGRSTRRPELVKTPMTSGPSRPNGTAGSSDRTVIRRITREFSWSRIILLSVLVVVLAGTVGTGVSVIDGPSGAIVDWSTGTAADVIGTQSDLPSDSAQPATGGASASGTAGGTGGAASVGGSTDASEREGMASAIEAAIVEMTNQARQQEGVSSLRSDADLADIARYHSSDMAEREYLAHTSPEGVSVSDRYERFGYACRVPVGGNTYATGSENIGYTYHGERVVDYGYIGDEEDVAESLVDGWMASPGHRENMLKPYWQNIGVGVAITETSEGTRVYATQNFC